MSFTFKKKTETQLKQNYYTKAVRGISGFNDFNDFFEWYNKEKKELLKKHRE